MKPIFTIHAGEYLVASEIEKKFKKLNVWLPAKDSGIDLLVTNSKNTKSVSLQVKFSKDFNSTHTKELFRKDIRSTGWWTLNKEKIKNSQADYWVFILYSFDKKTSDYVIIKPNELLNIFTTTNRNTKTIHCYITITNNKKAFETRGISKSKRSNIETDLTHTIRDLTKYLDNWGALKLLNK